MLFSENNYSETGLTYTHTKVHINLIYNAKSTNYPLQLRNHKMLSNHEQ